MLPARRACPFGESDGRNAAQHALRYAVHTAGDTYDPHAVLFNYGVIPSRCSCSDVAAIARVPGGSWYQPGSS